MTRRQHSKIVIDLNFTKFRRYSYSNLTPGSIHPLITPPKGEADNFQDKGVWVQGVDRPVKLTFKDFSLHYEPIVKMQRTK